MSAPSWALGWNHGGFVSDLANFSIGARAERYHEVVNRLVLGLVGVACEARQPPTPHLETARAAGVPADVATVAPAGRVEAVEAHGAEQGASADYYSLEELRALGLHVASAGEGQVLVCGTEAGSQCLCLMPLDCGADGCIQFTANVDAFKSTLAKPPQGAKAHCEKAATGACGTFKYFDFEGDLYRRELRWFDSTGVLVGQRNVTDYAAYCGKQTRARFQGRIPKCTTATRSELICGDAAGAMNPLDDVRRFAGPPARPGGTR